VCTTKLTIVCNQMPFPELAVRPERSGLRLSFAAPVSRAYFLESKTTLNELQWEVLRRLVSETGFCVDRREPRRLSVSFYRLRSE